MIECVLITPLLALAASMPPTPVCCETKIPEVEVGQQLFDQGEARVGY